MCFKIVIEKPKPKYPETQYSMNQIKEAILRYYPEMKFDFDDRRYWTVSAVAWGEIIIDVLKNMPAFLSEKFDCDNFAHQCACRVSFNYKLNTMGVVEGYHNGYRHKFNLFITDTLDIFLLEPQNGMIYDMSDTGGYTPDEILLG